jgi:hypothetical protein
VALLLISLAAVPFTAPFSTCGLSELLAQPIPVDILAHAAARATSVAADPSQAVSSFDETFKDHVVMPGATQSVAVRVVTDTAPPRAPRALSVSMVPLPLRL